MMTPDKLAEYTLTGRKAVASFLETILGESVSLQIRGPREMSSDTLEDRFERCYAILGRSRESEPFVVLVDREWLPFLSNAMLGNKLTEWNDETDDFLSEIASQVHATLQQAMVDEDVELHEANFTILPEIVALPSELLTDELLQTSIVLDTSEKHIEGHLLLPLSQRESAAGASDPGAAAGTEPTRSEGADRAQTESGPTPGKPTKPQAGPAPASDIGSQDNDESQVDVAFPSFPDFDDAENVEAGPDKTDKFELLGDVEIELAVELGRRQMPLQDILRLTNGSIVELDKLAGEPLQIYANNRLIAEGEAVVIDDQFGVRITRLASSDRRARALL